MYIIHSKRSPSTHVEREINFIYSLIGVDNPLSQQLYNNLHIILLKTPVIIFSHLTLQNLTTLNTCQCGWDFADSIQSNVSMLRKYFMSEVITIVLEMTWDTLFASLD